jgi:tRNA pseudouridine38-40 synthase
MCEVFDFDRAGDRYRVAMGVEYCGTAYRGWQIQRSGVPTIQAELEAAASKVANEPVATIVAGRTDAGVHATNQVVHFDTKSERTEYGWKMGINGRLPDDISIRWVKMVDTHFHARFSAKERAYRFIIHNSWVKSALLHNLTTWERYELDVNLMQQAADLLLGTHDFSSFRAAECQAHSPVRTLRELQIERFGEFVVLQARADGFLHHMVRNLVGVLLPIGRGRKPVEWAKEVLEYRDRTKGGVTAQGNGLYFVRAGYDRGDLPVMDAGPGFIQPLISNITNKFSQV